MTKKFDITLLQKSGTGGLTAEETAVLASMVNGKAVLPLDIASKGWADSYALGFMSLEAANKLSVSANSDLRKFIGGILADTDAENPDCEYQLGGLKIWMGYDIPDAALSQYRDSVYREVWGEYVKDDAASRAQDTGIEIDDEGLSMVAYRYVKGDYDCNLDYWTNIDNLLWEYGKEVVS